MRKLLLMFITLLLVSYSSKSQSNRTPEDVAKMTAQKIFKFCLDDDLDSLRVVAPSTILPGTTKDAIKAKFKPFKDIASEKGVPPSGDFKPQKKNQNSIVDALKYVPEKSSKAGVDSITLHFDQNLGFTQVSSFEIYRKK